MSSLFTQTIGQGQPIVALHGWGMNQQVWQPIQAELAKLGQVTFIDLAGHGRSSTVSLESEQQVVELLMPLIPENAIVMGWSLGGMLAQRLAQKLPHIKALILVTSTPRFTNFNDWEYGLDESIVTGFANNLQKNYEATVKRFFALQFMGVKTDTQALNAFRESIMQHPASLEALKEGMEILHSFNAGQQRIEQPCLWVLGRLDKLIPVQLKQGLEAMGYEHIEVMPRAAHVPFVTHPEEFMMLVRDFVQRYA